MHHGLVKGLSPLKGCLFQAIECLFQLQDFVLLAFSLETLWLFHVELHPEVNTPFHKSEELVCFFLFSGRVDGDEGFRWVTEGEGVDKATALKEGGLAINAASVVLVPLSDANDAALGGASKTEVHSIHLLPCSSCHRLDLAVSRL